MYKIIMVKIQLYNFKVYLLENFNESWNTFGQIAIKIYAFFTNRKICRGVISNVPHAGASKEISFGIFGSVRE